MKRKLIVGLILMMLGGMSPKLYDGAVAWWQHQQNAEPGAEAQKLIASLESGDGWRSFARLTVPQCPGVSKGRLRVILHTFHADIETDTTDVTDSFTRAERRAIQRAGETCLRKLTARAMDTAAAQ